MAEQPHYLCPCLENCPLHYAMNLIGGKWKVQILCALNAGGTLRYNALKRRLGSVSNTVLADALEALEKAGLVQRQEYLEVPVRVEYSITGEGKTLIPILEQLSDWAEARMKQEEPK